MKQLQDIQAIEYYYTALNEFPSTGFSNNLGFWIWNNFNKVFDCWVFNGDVWRLG